MSTAKQLVPTGTKVVPITQVPTGTTGTPPYRGTRYWATKQQNPENKWYQQLVPLDGPLTHHCPLIGPYRKCTRGGEVQSR